MGEDGGVSDLDVTTALTVLRHGDIDVEGRLVDASNATLFCAVAHSGVEARCVYKPVAGERPLWDFPNGSLAGREVAAYAVSEAAGWGVVPPTVLRDGPFGPGMVQLWVETDTDVDLVDVVAPGRVPAGWLHVLDALGSGGRPVVLAHADDARLRRMAVLDVVINNADRKGGHVLPLPDGTVHGVDHGVTFHLEPKLRTVLWGWAGEPLREDEMETLARLGERLEGDLGTELGSLLTRREVRETHRRIDRLVADGHLPLPGDGWPAIPWPPF
jgi:uncharacterized repeat protein (TIGR03843 family)